MNSKILYSIIVILLLALLTMVYFDISDNKSNSFAKHNLIDSDLIKINDINQISGYYKHPITVIYENETKEEYKYIELGVFNDFNDVFDQNRRCESGIIITKDFTSTFYNVCFYKQENYFKIKNYYDVESEQFELGTYEFYFNQNHDLYITQNNVDSLVIYKFIRVSYDEYMLQKS